MREGDISYPKFQNDPCIGEGVGAEIVRPLFPGERMCWEISREVGLRAVTDYININIRRYMRYGQPAPGLVQVENRKAHRCSGEEVW